MTKASKNRAACGASISRPTRSSGWVAIRQFLRGAVLAPSDGDIAVEHKCSMRSALRQSAIERQPTHSADPARR